MYKRALALLKEEDGQSMVEYGIIIALISVVAIGAVQTIGQRLNNAFKGVDTALDGAGFKPASGGGGSTN